MTYVNKHSGYTNLDQQESPAYFRINLSMWFAWQLTTPGNLMFKVGGPCDETSCVYLYTKYRECWNVGEKNDYN